MARRVEEGGIDDESGRPLKRLHLDPSFWAKLTALWHRERVREQYVAAGYAPPEARKVANSEALEVAWRHGWRGDQARLKRELAELVANELPNLRRGHNGRRPHYWEEMVHADMLRMLRAGPRELRADLVSYLRREVRLRGRLSGHRGFYKLALIAGYIPGMDHLERRNAFIQALAEVGHDPELCDRDLYRIVLRFSRPYTLRPYETRLGVSMPKRGPGSRRGPSTDGLGRRLLRLFRAAS